MAFSQTQTNATVGVSTFFGNSYSYLTTLDTRTERARHVELELADQGTPAQTDVRDLVPAPRGRAVLRVRNDFASGIVLVDRTGAAFIDERLANAIGRPAVHNARATWRHGMSIRTLPTDLSNRCPQPPAPSPADTFGSAGKILATADAITSDSWYCLRATGQASHLDGNAVRLLGPVAVVLGPADTRAVDLRTGVTISGPIIHDPAQRAVLDPTVGHSGTLVLLRVFDLQPTQIITASPGTPPREIAQGRLEDLRYQDGQLRYAIPRTDTTAAQIITTSLP